MKNNIIYITIAILFIGGVIFFAKQSVAPTSQETVGEVPSEENQTPVDSNPSQSTSTPQTPVAEGKVVTYTDAGYSPATLEVKVGDTVTFKNQSSKSMWTASAMHPTHLLYPTTGGCIGSTFDACKGVQIGGSWSFRFDIKGTWKYHDHLTPNYFGTIIVQ